MARQSGLDPGRLRALLALFFLALAVPTVVLVERAYTQLKWEAFHQHQQRAEELATRVEERLTALVDAEESRSFADYGFLVVLGDASANYLQRSALSFDPGEASFPGSLGHFQVDARGRLSTPLLPAEEGLAREFGLADGARADRVAREAAIERILVANRLLGPREAPVPPSREEVLDATAFAEPPRTSSARALEQRQATPQASFDALDDRPAAPATVGKSSAPSLGRVEDLELDYRFQSEPGKDVSSLAAPRRKADAGRRQARKELGAVPAPDSGPEDEAATPGATGRARSRITTFESELDPFEFARLDKDHLVLFRKVWRDGQRYVQGLLIEQARFLGDVVESELRRSALSETSDLIVAHRGDVLAAYRALAAGRTRSSAPDLSGALLYQTRLEAPLSDLELIFTIARLPPGPGARVVVWVAAILAIVLCGGFWLMYRLGMRQIALARQQQDFVSAVSHELKTPLTSIRMYGELLREGWASEEKKRAYYEYICDESERLTRLIANVLQLARMTRNDLEPALEPVAVSTLVDELRSKTSSLAERAGFELVVECPADAGESVILVDTDFFSQIMINLVDNALKFSARAERKTVEVRAAVVRGGSIRFGVRDHGPGIPKDQMKKIFSLFYRSETGLTRETVGTGIGLSLVHQLAESMGARVDVVNAGPGAEFRVLFPAPHRPPPMDTH